MTTAAPTALSPAVVPFDKSDIDKLCINTIRTLAWMRCRRPTPGHPGAAMALAPVVYKLWSKFLRYDPEDPTWPNRDRFVLSAGHASMLLYSLLHLTGVEASQRQVRDRSAGRPCPWTTSRSSAKSTASAPAIPEYRWTTGVETTTGPLGQGIGQQRRHGHRRALAGRPLQQARLRDVRLHRLRHRAATADMMEGVSSEAASPGRPPQARQPMLDLRQQPHHHRGPHRPGLQRGCRRPLPGLRLECRSPSPTPTTCTASSRRDQEVQQGPDKPTLIIVDTHIGYGSPTSRTRTSSPRRAARRRGGQARQALLRLARGCPVPGPRRRPRALHSRHRQARQASPRRAGSPSSPNTRPVPRPRPTNSIG